MKHKNLFILFILLVGVWTMGFAQSAYFPGPPAAGNLPCIQVTTPANTIISTYTVEAWIYPTVLNSAISDINEYGFTVLASSAVGGTFPLWITFWNRELRIWTWENTGTFNLSRQTSGANIPLNAWTHIAVTSTKGGNTTVYVGGVNMLSFTNDGETNWTAQMSIGALRTTRIKSNLPFFGMIDEVRLWSDLRTATEINDNKSNELDLSDPVAKQGLVGYWNFNTGHADLSGNNLLTEPKNGALDYGAQSPVLPFGTLPVELSSFTAIPTAEYFVRLNWVTQSETGVSGFKIYRGRNNNLAEAIDMNVFIEATNTASTQIYTYVDNSLEGNGTYYYWLQNIDLDGGSRYYGPVTANVSQTGGGDTPPIEQFTGIEKIYPNPFNPQTNIRFSLAKDSAVEVVIFNLRGQKVRNLFADQKTAGFHNLEWNGLDNSGMPCSSGVYTVQLRIGTEVYSRLMVMSK